MKELSMTFLWALIQRISSKQYRLEILSVMNKGMMNFVVLIHVG